MSLVLDVGIGNISTLATFSAVLAVVAQASNPTSAPYASMRCQSYAMLLHSGFALGAGLAAQTLFSPLRFSRRIF